MSEDCAESIEPYLALVGRISAAWAVLDLYFDSAIAHLLGGDPNAVACVTTQFNSHYPKLKAVIALCKHKGASRGRVKELEKFLGALNDLSERRNRAVHDAWLLKNGKIVGKVNFGGVRAAHPSSIEDLTNLSNLIIDRGIKFLDITSSIYAEMREPSPKSNP